MLLLSNSFNFLEKCFSGLEMLITIFKKNKRGLSPHHWFGVEILSSLKPVTILQSCASSEHAGALFLRGDTVSS